MIRVCFLLGVNSYRMSLAWTRIVPSGKKGGEVNKKAVAWYRDVLQALQDANITPFVTLYHWDLPQSLHDEYGGWLDRRIVDDFEYYARVCFENLGDLVENWFTHNEPNILACVLIVTSLLDPCLRSGSDL